MRTYVYEMQTSSFSNTETRGFPLTNYFPFRQAKNKFTTY